MMSKHYSKTPSIKSSLFAALALPTALLLSTPASFGAGQSTTETNQEQASQNESNSTQEQGFIRDDLFVYMHAGSSTKFKIIGSINAATAVEKLDSNPETKYIQIKDDKGRIGWIDSISFTTDTPASLQLAQAKEHIKQLEEQNLKTEAQVSQLQQELEHTKQTSINVASMLELSETEKVQLQQQITETTSKHEIKQMMFGAGIIVVGLILGLILPHIAPRKRRGDHWV